MSFAFPSWETAFSPAFYESAKGTLETALNKGNKPPVIQGRIEVVELSMGTQPPTLTLLEIGDLSLDRFRGILRLGYQGDAWLEVRCRVQANPLSHNPNLLPSSTLPLSTPLLASQPLLVPMTLRLSKLHLRAILILVVSASKGITLVFKNDPLQNVDVSSTFDSVEVIRGYLQQEIEGQLREMFREDLPGIIHRLSQRWFTGSGVGGRVEMPYMDGPGINTPGKPQEDEEDMRSSDPYAEKPIFPPYQPTPSLSQLTPKRRALAQHAARTRRLSTAISESPSAYTTLPGIEDYDPTYGLRPEGVPTHSGYEAFGRLWEKAREGGSGLGSLMRIPVGTHDGEVSDQEEDEDVFGLDGENDSVEAVEAHEVLGALSPGLGRPGGLSRRNSNKSRMSSRADDTVEWETYPAVGGGIITRPRVYHAQSQIRAPSEVGCGAIPSPSATGAGTSVTARASSAGGASSTVGSLRRQNTGLRTPGGLPIAQPQYRPSSSAIAGPGPSSLRRMVTSRSDVFLSHSAAPQNAHIPTSASHATLSQPDRQSRRQSGIPPHAKAPLNSGTSPLTGSSSWSNTDPARSSYSTLPSSTSLMSIPSPPRTHLRTPSLSTSPLSPSSFPPRHSIIGPGGITLPMNNSVSQLAALSNSAHTLSPYARGHEHIAVRSFPHLGRGGSSAGVGSGRSEVGGGGVTRPQVITGDGRVKGNRKRVFKLGGNTKIKEKAVEIQGEVDDFMPLGAISPHLADSRQLSPITQTRSLYSLDKLSLGHSDQAPPIPQDRQRKYRPTSLTGLASAMMMSPPAAVQTQVQRGLGGISGSTSLSGLAGLRDGGLRPNLLRSPDSRSSYGFPTAGNRRYGS